MSDNIGFLKKFGMIRVPFTPNIGIEYLSKPEQFTDTLNRLNYVAGNQMFAVLTGIVGVGKSTVLRAFSNGLSPESYEVLYISQSNLSPRWLYSIPLNQMGIDPRFYANDAKKQFHEALFSLTAVKHKNVVMIIDEAHLINHRTLQEIRFLLNCKFDAGNPLCLILAGQNELWQVLEREENMAISQRIDMICRMTALTDNQVGMYIASHLRYAGAKEQIFSSEAIEEISRKSQGVPRLINKICTHSLLYAASQGTELVTRDIVASAIKNELPKCVLL